MLLKDHVLLQCVQMGELGQLNWHFETLFNYTEFLKFDLNGDVSNVGDFANADS